MPRIMSWKMDTMTIIMLRHPRRKRANDSTAPIFHRAISVLPGVNIWLATFANIPGSVHFSATVPGDFPVSITCASMLRRSMSTRTSQATPWPPQERDSSGRSALTGYVRRAVLGRALVLARGLTVVVTAGTCPRPALGRLLPLSASPRRSADGRTH